VNNLKINLNSSNAQWRRIAARVSGDVPQTLLDQIKDARRDRIANKTKERERERRGEILPITEKRARQRPPFHTLLRMSEQAKEEDKAMRQSISEVGYIGELKVKNGWKVHEGRRGPDGLKERELNKGRGKTWSVLDAAWVGSEDTQCAEEEYSQIDTENERRRQMDDDPKLKQADSF
jgi:hypothetical protein